MSSLSPAGYQGSWGAAEEVAEIFAKEYKP